MQISQGNMTLFDVWGPVEFAPRRIYFGVDMDEFSKPQIPRVLIVDDDQAIADTLAVIFRNSGYETRAAYSAEHAIETIAQWAPDMALIDVMLPGMNGIDLAIVLKANYITSQTLLISGSVSTGALLEEAAKKGHMFEILPKPVHPTFILERVKGMLTGGCVHSRMD